MLLNRLNSAPNAGYVEGYGHCEGDNQQTDNRVIECLFRPARRRDRVINVLVEFDAFRRNLEYPGSDQGNQESRQDEDHVHLEGALSGAKRR
jgi:hypothetical protein